MQFPEDWRDEMGVSAVRRAQGQFMAQGGQFYFALLAAHFQMLQVSGAKSIILLAEFVGNSNCPKISNLTFVDAEVRQARDARKQAVRQNLRPLKPKLFLSRTSFERA